MYVKDYKEWPLGNNTCDVDPNMLTRTNYNTGTQKGQHNHYDSLYKSDYPEHPVESAQLNEDQKSDLRKHHFKFGYGDIPNKTSNYQDEYVEKEVPQDIRKEFNETKEQARASVSYSVTVRPKSGWIRTAISRPCTMRTILRNLSIL